MGQYTSVSKNGEIAFDQRSQKYHVFDETYSEVIYECASLHDAEIALKSYCAQLDKPTGSSIAPVLEKLCQL